MKVSDTKTTASVQSPAVAPESDVTARGVPAPDRVTTEGASRLRDSTSNGINMAAAERALRIQSLTQQVRSGTYRPSASRLAEEILAQADLDARLASGLH